MNKSFPPGHNYRKINWEVKVLNSVTLIGRLTKDAELVQLENYDRSVVKFILAVGRDFVSKTGEREADFIPIVTWRKLAETCARFLSKGKYLVVNIVAGTTDVALFNNMQFVKGSKDTFPIGGNTIRELLISELYKRYRFRISVNAAEQAIKTGKVDIGSKIVSVPELVEEVKRKFSLQLMDTIKRYLTQISQALPELTAVVCVGGGALEGKYVKEEEERIILSTTSYLSDYVKVNAPFTEVLVHSKPRFADADGCWIVLCTKEKTTNK